jgi:hypothetical protein
MYVNVRTCSEDISMASDKFFVSGGVEPLACTIDTTKQVTGDSRSKIYELIGDGTYEAVKSGTRTLIIFESIKRRIASLPRAKIQPPKPRPPHPKRKSGTPPAA